jgi:hypothetical protein
MMLVVNIKKSTGAGMTSVAGCSTKKSLNFLISFSFAPLL